MKWFLLIVLIFAGIYFYTKKKITQDVINASSPVRYTEGLRHARDKAEDTAERANAVIQKQSQQMNQVTEGNQE